MIILFNILSFYTILRINTLIFNFSCLKKVKFFIDKRINVNYLNFFIKFSIVFIIAIVLFIFSTLWYFSIGLSDYKKLSNYQPPISSRVYSEDGKLIAEYALQKTFCSLRVSARSGNKFFSFCRR